jgi:hypothetical protein
MFGKRKPLEAPAGYTLVGRTPEYIEVTDGTRNFLILRNGSWQAVS